VIEIHYLDHFGLIYINLTNIIFLAKQYSENPQMGLRNKNSKSAKKLMHQLILFQKK
jgi:hypothetical protein